MSYGYDYESSTSYGYGGRQLGRAMYGTHAAEVYNAQVTARDDLHLGQRATMEKEQHEHNLQVSAQKGQYVEMLDHHRDNARGSKEEAEERADDERRQQRKNALARKHARDREIQDPRQREAAARTQAKAEALAARKKHQAQQVEH
jgi:hypothetical protein